MTDPPTANWKHSLTALQAFICDGGYRPGDRLPPERELIERLCLTRATLRRALDALEREGVIWRHVGKGTFLSETGGEGQGGSFADLGKRLTPVKMMRARACIEPAIAREAAINASTEALDRIRQARDINAAAPDWAAYQQSDDAFHRTIAAASDNALLVALFDRLNQVKRDVTWGNITEVSGHPQWMRDSFAEHAAICRAIEARDAGGAQEAMRRHIGSVSARFFGEI